MQNIHGNADGEDGEGARVPGAVAARSACRTRRRRPGAEAVRAGTLSQCFGSGGRSLSWRRPEPLAGGRVSESQWRGAERRHVRAGLGVTAACVRVRRTRAHSLTRRLRVTPCRPPAGWARTGDRPLLGHGAAVRCGWWGEVFRGTTGLAGAGGSELGTRPGGPAQGLQGPLHVARASRDTATGSQRGASRCQHPERRERKLPAQRRATL